MSAQLKYTLKAFLFLNHPLDTVCLVNLDKPIIIETWDETCSPCIKSIKEMEEALTNNPNFVAIYLYQIRRKKRLSNQAIVNYKLMFNTLGKLMGTRSGYRSEDKTVFIEELEKLVATT